MDGVSDAGGEESWDCVEEFTAVEVGERKEEKLSKVRDLAGRGKLAYDGGRYDEAIRFYSKALALKPGDLVILGNRSTTFRMLCQLLRERPASESEYLPLNGLDPTTHAELALKDAEKVLSVCSDSPRSYYLKASALILLERYREARECILAGLQVDPLSHLLQICLKNLDEKTICLSGVDRKLDRTDDFECTLCFKLLYEPVTTPCGHSFCRSCLQQSLDHGNKCPMCRTVLFISPRTYPVSVTLNNIIQKSFPEEHAERKSEHESITCLGIDVMPLFVMDVVVPCQKLYLNIFEPRYRLMVRRIMEGNHRMGMVGFDPATGTISDFACEVEIVECKPLPDGKFYLEVEGRRRFRIVRSWDQDGYRVAQIEWQRDLPADGSGERDELVQMVNEVAELVETTRIGRRSRQLDFPEAESMPSLNDHEKFSFWLLNLLNLSSELKLELLRLTDTRERLLRLRPLVLLRAERAEQEGCNIQ